MSPEIDTEEVPIADLKFDALQRYYAERMYLCSEGHKILPWVGAAIYCRECHRHQVAVAHAGSIIVVPPPIPTLPPDVPPGMFPIPTAILERYAIRCDIPGRPWWRQAGRGWLRCDGHTLFGQPFIAEDIDRANPLPKPPIRVGQVWAWYLDHYVSAMMVTHARDCPPDAAFLIHDPFVPGLFWAPTSETP